VLAFDVNGRINGSSVALAVFGALEDPERRFARYGSWAAGGSEFAHLERAVRRAMESSVFVPLAFYDPRGGDRAAPPRVSGLVVGASREEVLQIEKDLAASLC
jgi:hypothetical protein